MTADEQYERPEILPLEDEREILYARACEQVRIGLSIVRQDMTVAEATDAICGMAVQGVLSALMFMSGRQMAVLLAREASHGVGYTIHEPPRYTAEEIDEVSS